MFVEDIPSARTKIFNRTAGGNGTGTGAGTIAFNIPENANMINIVAIGGGGKGGDGFVNSQGGGGGGGGSGGYSSITIPTKILPKQLYIYVGKGGDTESLSSSTFVMLDLQANNILLYSSGGSVGAVGGVASGGAGGTGGTVQPVSNYPYISSGIYQTIAGQTGATGGANTSGLSITLPTTGIPCTGGAGGGSFGSGFVGGDITGNSGSDLFPTLKGGGQSLPGTTYSRLNPLISYGGTGGGGDGGGAGFGGKGGKGGFGSGGGGGGGSNTTAGLGGPGGDGIVIINWW